MNRYEAGTHNEGAHRAIKKTLVLIEHCPDIVDMVTLVVNEVLTEQVDLGMYTEEGGYLGTVGVLEAD